MRFFTLSPHLGIGMENVEFFKITAKPVLICRRKDSSYVTKEDVLMMSKILPILVVCENSEPYVRGFGRLLITKAEKRTFQIISLYDGYIEYLNRVVIIDYEIVGRIVAIVRGFKDKIEDMHVYWARGVKNFGYGVIYEVASAWEEIPLLLSLIVRDEKGNEIYRLDRKIVLGKLVPVNKAWTFELSFEEEHEEKISKDEFDILAEKYFGMENASKKVEKMLAK